MTVQTEVLLVIIGMLESAIRAKKGHIAISLKLFILP